MSLFNYRLVVHHLVVMKALHDVQFTACIGCTEFSIQRIPKLLPVCYVQVHITQTVGKDAQNTSSQGRVGFLELFLIFIRHSSLRLAISDPKYFQSSKPERGLDLPPLEVHTSEFIRSQCIG